MKISTKLIIGFVLVASLVVAIGYAATSVSEGILADAVGTETFRFAQEVMDEIDIAINSRVGEVVVFSHDIDLRESIAQSNALFEQMPDVNTYIAGKDAEWASALDGTETSFMKEVLDAAASKSLREKVEFYKQKYGRPVFGEVLVTNRYGALVGSSGVTSDFNQAGEEWWQKASSDGLYVTGVTYDKTSGVYSVGICVRLDDDEGNFMGVMKASLDIEDLARVIKEEPVGGNDERRNIDYELFTRDGLLIYSTVQGAVLLENRSGELGRMLLESAQTSRPYIMMQGGGADEDMKMRVFAQSVGYGDYKGSGWYLIVDRSAAEALSPVNEMRKTILLISLGMLAMAFFVGVMVSHAIASPLREFTGTIERIGAGQLDAEVSPVLKESGDEISELSNAIERMIVSLKFAMKTPSPELKGEGDALEKLIEEKNRVEKALLESEERFKDFFESANDLIQSVDAEGRFLYVNRKWRETLGYSEDEIKNLRFSDILQKECLQRCMDVLKDVSKGSTLNNVEAVFVAKDGREIRVEGSISPLFEAGVLTATRAIFCDVTERKKAEDALTMLASIVTYSNDAIIGNNLEGTITSWNKGAEKLYGYTEDEMRGKNISVILPEDRKDELRQILEKVGKGETVENFESKRLRKDGSVVDVSLAVSPIQDSSGIVVGVSSIAHDITEHRRAEALAEENLQFLQMLIDSIPSPVFYKDLKGVYLGCNKACQDYIGLPKEKIIGRTVYDIYPQDMADKYNKADLDLLQKGGLQTYESSVMQADGKRHDVVFSKATFAGKDGKPAGLIGSVFDVTSLRQTEEKLRESESKFNVLFNYTSDAILIHGFDGKFVEVNKTACDRLRYTRGELLGRGVSMIETSDYASLMPQRMDELRQKGYAMFETEHLRKDGKKIPVDVSSRVIEYDGRPAVLGIARDITKRKTLEGKIAHINEIISEAIKKDSIEDVYELVQKKSVELTDSEFGFVGVKTPEGWMQIVSASSFGLDAHNLPKKDMLFKDLNNLFGAVLTTGASIRANEPLKHPTGNGVLPEGLPPLSSFLGVPVISQGETLANLCVANKRGGYDEIDQTVLEVLAAQISGFIKFYRCDKVIKI